jgi:aminocarboxymuconate-semialdehyde decarboxylase
MQSPELAVQELKRCVQELGLAGVQIGSHVNEWNLDAPELQPIFACAEELGAAIFVHPWDMDMKRMEKYWFPWLVGMVTNILYFNDFSIHLFVILAM